LTLDGDGKINKNNSLRRSFYGAADAGATAASTHLRSKRAVIWCTLYLRLTAGRGAAPVAGQKLELMPARKPCIEHFC
jgi:hypothetical protein